MFDSDEIGTLLHLHTGSFIPATSKPRQNCQAKHIDKHIHYMYNNHIMIRTQMYIEEEVHKGLQYLAEQEQKSMAEVTRAILKEGIKKEENN